MTLQPQTYYRTRDGHKARVSEENPFRPGEWQGWILRGSRHSVDRRWNSGGECSVRREDHLIAVWTDRPADEDGWAIVDDGEAVVEPSWEYLRGDGHWVSVSTPMCGMSVLAQSIHANWLWFRRPVPPPAPREWWLVPESREMFETSEEAQEFVQSAHAGIPVHVIEKPKETT